MTYKNQLINGLKQGFLFYAFSTILIAIQFSFYIVGSPILDYMDFEGWVFFAASCVSHASQFALVPYLLGFLVLLCRFPKTARVVQIVGVVLLCVLNYLNSQVYAIYHFHINGFVLSMVFGEGAGEIFNFDALLYLKEAGLFAIVAAIVVGVWYLSHRVWLLRKKAYVWLVAGIFVGCTLYAHLWHIYAAFYQHQSVMKSATLLPYYFPTTSNGLLLKWGCKQPRGVGQTNGTRSGVFSLFFGLSCYYWESFEPARVQPLLIRRLQALGYDIQTYPSATWADPPFGRVIFGGVPGIHTETKGNTALERDTRVANMFIADMEGRKDKKKPFFSFLFFDLPHSFELPADKNKHFQPAWAFADYTKLNNDMDPTPFWNLYRNTCYQDDLLLGKVFEALKKQGLMDNTIVVLTGDHSQEFNENHRNYWGHNSNFSVHQIGVPMIWHVPGQQAHKYTHRTTHYDMVPTLMKEYLGVKNPTDDYSMGRLMTDKTPRLWHVVGSNLNYAFIIGKDSILEKTAQGSLDVYDAKMNPVKNYVLPAKQFDKAMKQLNRFFK